MMFQIEKPEIYRVAKYIRLSKDDENEGESESVSNQRSLLDEFVAQNKLAVYDEYVDDGWSGGNFDRPAFKRLIGDIEAGKVNMVVTKDLSRLGRDYIGVGEYLERYFPIQNVRYISLLDGIDTGVESSTNDITPFRAICNDFYARDTSKKIRSVKHDKQRKGLFIGGKAPFGYVLSKTEKNHLEIDPDAAQLVQKIFAMAQAGISCRQIATSLNNDHIPPPSVYAGLTIGRVGPYSGLWSSERVTEMLRNEMYIGNMVQGRTKKINYKTKKCRKVPREDWVVVEGTHEPIISRDVFEQVQQMIDSRRYTRSRKYEYPLKGLIFCNECNYPLGVINRKNAAGDDVLYFVCRTYQRFTNAGVCTPHCIQEKRVTAAVMAQVHKVCHYFVLRDKLVEKGAEAFRLYDAQTHALQELKAVNEKLQQMERKLAQVYNDRLNGLLAVADFQHFYDNLCKERVSMQERRDELEAEVSQPPQDYHERALMLAKRFLETDVCSRELLVALVERVELTSEKALIVKFRFRELELEQNSQ